MFKEQSLSVKDASSSLVKWTVGATDGLCCHFWKTFLKNALEHYSLYHLHTHFDFDKSIRDGLTNERKNQRMDIGHALLYRCKDASTKTHTLEPVVVCMGLVFGQWL